jgi:transposase
MPAFRRYCKDGKRRGSYEHTSFTFLGDGFRVRKVQTKHGDYFFGFNPAVSDEAAKRIRAQIRSWRLGKKLIEQRTSEAQRLSKTLEDGGIKIDSVASELLGKSGRDMIEALIAGVRNPGVLADLARGVLRRKIDDLQMACDGRFTESHAQMCRLHLDAYDHLTAQIAGLDQLVAGAAAPFAALIARLVTIPGIGPRTAQVIVAETGGDMTRFATSARLAAPAGLAPGDNESAGKRKKAAARKGNQHLKTAMTESAWTVGRTATRPGARFRRLARRFGRGNEKKAAFAVAHTLICIAWAVMTHDQDYAEAGEQYYEQRDHRNHEHLVRHHQQALARLGYQVALTGPGDGRPPPGTHTPPLQSLARLPDHYCPVTGEPSPAGSAGAAARGLGTPSFITEGRG